MIHRDNLVEAIRLEDEAKMQNFMRKFGNLFIKLTMILSRRRATLERMAIDYWRESVVHRAFNLIFGNFSRLYICCQ